MTVKIITESVCDLPEQITKELGITIIPLPVHFGNEVYSDGVDISNEEFYQKLETSKVFPTTAIPPPGDFINAYTRAAEEADEVLHIALSSKLSGLYDAAKLAVDLMPKKCRVEVLDSQWVIMAEGFLAMKAARAARDEPRRRRRRSARPAGCWAGCSSWCARSGGSSGWSTG